MLKQTPLNRFLLIGLFLFVLISVVIAIEYPIDELGGCSSEIECKAYCDVPEHVESCLDFAEENGLMDKEEIEKARKVLPYILEGTTPGGCRSKDECDAYCSKDENLDECVDFALRIGEIDEQEAEMIRKTGGKGPGGCRGKEECDEYCKDHIQECMEFAKEYGLMDEGDMMGPQQHEMNEEEKCMMECMEREGIDFDECKPGKDGEMGGSGCKKCAEECVKFYEGPCLTEEQWREKEEECMSKGEHMEARPIEADNGDGGMCAVDLECIDRSDEWEVNPEEDMEMDAMGDALGAEEDFVPDENFSEELEEEMPDEEVDFDGGVLSGAVVKELRKNNVLLNVLKYLFSAT